MTALAKTTPKIAIASVAASLANNQQLTDWIASQASSCQLSYMLAHADDGIIWGRFDPEGRLKTADQVFGAQPSQGAANLPLLRLLTLQQCRIFGPKGEVFLWKSGHEWRSRYISTDWEQSYLSNEDCIEEKQLLWGTKGIQKDGFTLLSDGSQGLKHAIPTTEGITFEPGSDELSAPARLAVRHYITYSECDGSARVFLSRLVDFIS